MDDLDHQVLAVGYGTQVCVYIHVQSLIHVHVCTVLMPSTLARGNKFAMYVWIAFVYLFKYICVHHT